MTAIATAVLVLHMPNVSELAATARRTDAPGLEELGSDLVHATTLGLVVLVVILVLNVYKPRGLTRYGIRRQREGAHSHHRRRPPRRVGDDSAVLSQSRSGAVCPEDHLA